MESSKPKRKRAPKVLTEGKVDGRPKITLEEQRWKDLLGLMKIQCTQAECASVLDIDIETLNRLIFEREGLTFPEFFKKYSGSGKASLRRIQWHSAQEGSVPMQIWLGKQWLGQTDRLQEEVKKEVKHSVDEKLGETLASYSIDQLIDLTKGVDKAKRKEEVGE